MEPQNNELVIAQASRWYARLRAPDCSEAERMEFARWSSLDRRNVRAYAEAERVAAWVSESLMSNSRLRELAAAALAESSETASAETARETAFRKFAGWPMAASVLLGLSLAVIAGNQLVNHRGDAMTSVSHSNTTRQQQRIVLEDGSVVFLDVDSRVTVTMSKADRQVELLAGRAYFEVTHNSSRPFFVNAGTLRTVDLGTRFQVTRAANDVSVTLVEGAVAVADRSNHGNWNEALIPGEQLMIHVDTGSREKRVVDASALTSWSQGRLMFKGTPLAEALDEVNRYSEVKIRIGDERLAAIPIGGNFAAGADSSQIIDALVAVLPLRVVHVGANEIVLFQRYETETP